MAGPAKRTRNGDENSASTPPASSSSTDDPQSPTRRSNTPTTPNTAPPTTRANSASRRPATRSSQSSQSIHGSGRRTNLGLSTSSSNFSPVRPGLGTSESPSGPFPAGPSTRSAGNGMLLRTQSAPMVASPVHAKAMAGSSDPEAAPKGGCDGLGLGGRRFGKGKENIPPKKDEEQQAEPARKRMRVTSRGSYSGQAGRTRSGSVNSVRSETSGRHASLAPSLSSSSMSGWGGRLASPSPSQTSTPSSEAVSQLDRLSVSDKAEDAAQPLKHRPITRSIAMLPPTPPPSTPPDGEFEGNVSIQVSDVSDAETERPPSNPYKQLKSYLRLSTTTGTTVDEVIVGRQQEKAALRAYLEGTAGDDVGMYVSGPPGTGKTALATALGREMAQDGWKVVELGCMGVKTSEIWKKIGEELECGKTEKDIKEFLSEENKVFIILDEVDSLMPPPPGIAPPSTSHLLAKLFSLPLSSSSTKLVAISNTLDLTIRARLVLPNDLQPEILPFKAYGQTDMSAIVNARISAANVETVKVDSAAVTLLGKKVEAQNGDLRMCLGVLGSAISLAEAEWTRKLSHAANEPEPKPVAMTKVSIPHVMKAFTSYTSQLRSAAGSSVGGNSATDKKVKSVPIQGKMVLVAMLIFISRSRVGMNGCPSLGNAVTSAASFGGDISASAVYTTYSHVLSHSSSPLAPAPEHDYHDLLSNLETLGLISLTSATGRASTNKMSFTVREDDVKLSLGIVEGSTKGAAEEEVKKVWDREDAKVKRVRERLLQAQKMDESA